MQDMLDSGALALKATQSAGFYNVAHEQNEPYNHFYTIEVNDRAGVAFLRRLLTVDVRNIHRSEVRPSFVLNALGFITDFVTVAHLPDSDEHFRVVFQSIDTLAWMNQVAKAFDVEIEELGVASAMIYGEKLPSFDGLQDDHCVVLADGVVAMKTPYGILLQGEEAALDATLTPLGLVEMDAMATFGAAIVAKELYQTDWMMGDVTVDAVNGAAFVDFTDPARVFIGRALTEARVRAMSPKKTVVLRSHMDDPLAFFEKGEHVVIADAEGNLLAKTDHVGLLGDKLIAAVVLDADVDASRLLWIVGMNEEPLAYTVDVIA